MDLKDWCYLLQKKPPGFKKGIWETTAGSTDFQKRALCYSIVCILFVGVALSLRFWEVSCFSWCIWSILQGVTHSDSSHGQRDIYITFPPKTTTKKHQTSQDSVARCNQSQPLHLTVHQSLSWDSVSLWEDPSDNSWLIGDRRSAGGSAIGSRRIWDGERKFSFWIESSSKTVERWSKYPNVPNRTAIFRDVQNQAPWCLKGKEYDQI